MTLVFRPRVSLPMECQDFHSVTFGKESSFVMVPEGPGLQSERPVLEEERSSAGTGLISAARSRQPTGNDEMGRDSAGREPRSDRPARWYRAELQS